MKILGIDTSSKFLNIALSENEDIIREESHLLDRRHASQLVPKVKELLKKSRTSINKIDAFIIGLGPGSFTGLRIGKTRKPIIEKDIIAIHRKKGKKSGFFQKTALQSFFMPGQRSLPLALPCRMRLFQSIPLACPGRTFLKQCCLGKRLLLC